MPPKLPLVAVIAVSAGLVACENVCKTSMQDGPALLPVPTDVLDLDTFMGEIAVLGRIWTEVYSLNIPEPASGRNVRLTFRPNANGKDVTFIETAKSSKPEECSFLTGAFTLIDRDSNNSLAYFNVFSFHVNVGQTMFISQCASEYFWAWLCSLSEIKESECKGRALLSLYVNQDTPNKVPYEMATLDLNRLGYRFTDSRMRLAFIGDHESSVHMGCP